MRLVLLLLSLLCREPPNGEASSVLEDGKEQYRRGKALVCLLLWRVAVSRLVVSRLVWARAGLKSRRAAPLLSAIRKLETAAQLEPSSAEPLFYVCHPVLHPVLAALR